MAFKLIVGCGLAAISAAKAGALSALSSDIDPDCEHIVQLNCTANNVEVDTSSDDLLREMPQQNGGRGSSTLSHIGPSEGTYDVILLGDICYEKDTSVKFLRFVGMASYSSHLFRCIRLSEDFSVPYLIGKHVCNGSEALVSYPSEGRRFEPHAFGIELEKLAEYEVAK